MPGFGTGRSVRVEFPFEFRGERVASDGRVAGFLQDGRARVVFTTGALLEGTRLEQAIVPLALDTGQSRPRGQAPEHDSDRLAAEFRIRKLFASGDEALIAADQHGRVQLWNDAATRLYGWTADEAIGHLLSDLIVPQISVAQGVAIMNHVAAGRIWAGDFVVRRRDGTPFVTHVVTYPVMDASGAPVGAVGVSSPIPHVPGTPYVGYQVGDPVRVQFPFSSAGSKLTSEGIVVNALAGTFFRVHFPDPQDLDGFAIEQAIAHVDRFT